MLGIGLKGLKKLNGKKPFWRVLILLVITSVAGKLGQKPWMVDAFGALPALGKEKPAPALGKPLTTDVSGQYFMAAIQALQAESGLAVNIEAPDGLSFNTPLQQHTAGLTLLDALKGMCQEVVGNRFSFEVTSGKADVVISFKPVPMTNDESRSSPGGGESSQKLNSGTLGGPMNDPSGMGNDVIYTPESGLSPEGMTGPPGMGMSGRPGGGMGGPGGGMGGPPGGGMGGPPGGGNGGPDGMGGPPGGGNAGPPGLGIGAPPEGDNPPVVDNGPEGMGPPGDAPPEPPEPSGS